MSHAPPARSRMSRALWWLLAYASLGIGIVGIFVPGLPTTVFVLLSAYAAARGSGRLHRWLLAHPRFGPAIADWQAHGAVSAAQSGPRPGPCWPAPRSCSASCCGSPRIAAG